MRPTARVRITREKRASTTVAAGGWFRKGARRRAGRRGDRRCAAGGRDPESGPAISCRSPATRGAAPPCTERSRGPDPRGPGAIGGSFPAVHPRLRRPLVREVAAARPAGGAGKPPRGVVLVRAPERGERLAVRALAQLLERAVADLADALAGDAEQRADLLERPLLAVVQAVVEVEDLALALRQVLLEHLVQELAPRLRLDGFLDVLALDAGEALAERGAVPVAPVHRRIQRELGGGDP